MPHHHSRSRTGRCVLRHPRLLGIVALVLAAAARGVAGQSAASISGAVLEAGTGRPLPSARVFVPGTSASAVTNQAGKFLLRNLAPGDTVVRAILIGYAPGERRVSVAAGRTTPVELELAPQPLRLDEVVVTGTAGPAKRREVGHSLARIDPAQIAEPVASVDNLLTARVPGLSVLQSSGMAGSGSQIRLRGNASVSLSNQPLVLVDGVRIRSDGYPKNIPPVGETTRGANDVPSPLNDINPADIERVEVIRGPAATTLYGAEAATGVVQIFTKHGSSGRPEWAVQADRGYDRVRPFGPAAEPYMRLDRWLGTGLRQKYALSVGGGGAAQYFLSGLYDDNGGVLPNDAETRGVVRGNFDFSPSAKLHLTWSSSYTKHDIRNTPAGPSSQGLTMNVYRGPKNFIGDTSKAALDRILDWDIRTSIDHIVGGVSATYAMSPRLSHHLTIGYDRAASDMRSLRPYGFIFTPTGILSDQRWASEVTTVDYVGRAELTPARPLHATVSWGGQGVTTVVGDVAGYAESFPGPGDPTLSAGAQRLAFEDRSRVVTGGMFGQVLLDLDSRYYLTAGARLDGSSAFGADLGMQLYPRVNASYILSDEPFWPRGVGEVKLRAAYGHAGRAPGAFDALRTWSAVGFDGQPAFVPGVVGNPKLGPERTAETEVGVDGAFLHDRLTAEFTYYRRLTTDLLFPVTQVPSKGFLGTQLENVGSLRNTGVELALTAGIVRRPSIAWDVGLTLETNHSKVLDLGGAPTFNVGQGGWVVAGQPAPVIIAPKVVNADELAAPVIEQNHVYGPNVPTRIIGAHTTLTLPRGVELSAVGEYAGGHYLFDHASRNLAQFGVWPVCNDAYALVAQGQSDRLTAWQRVWCVPSKVPSTGLIYPGDFFRLRSVTLLAPLPSGLLRARSATVSVSARNAWTWKNHGLLAFDPEMVGREGMHSPVRVIDMLVPPPATLTFSVRAVY